MAERWEIIIDFSRYKNQNLILSTTTTFLETDYANTSHLLQFRVFPSVTDTSNNDPLPARLASPLKLPITAASAPPSATKTFTLTSHMDSLWTINGRTFAYASSRVLANPPLGAVEHYTFRSTGMMGAHPSWTHAMHLHLVDAQLLSRRGGRDALEPYEVGSTKDVVVLGDGEEVDVAVRFVPYRGVYMMHCHNLVHEDRGMMAAFNVSALPGLDYPAETVGLEDPMDKRFRARVYEGTDLEQVRREVLPAFARLGAYPDLEGLVEAVDEVWAKGGVVNPDAAAPTTTTTTTTSGSGGAGGMMGGGMMGGHHGGGGMMSGDSGGGGNTPTPSTAPTSSGSGVMSDSGGNMMGGSGSGMMSEGTHKSHHGGGGMTGSGANAQQ
ncbi:hypothetical protein LTS18_011257 [Coniosporium uncinatum]|uniref:Uncharacterized protein n=1 Tax=Coniosporium uncinatum TaxID=93489 RepID=A0ACC3CYZ9_9PEZI|nr:hypothetical protein LTS18_011257 [Coniosporium uncinatum]